MSGSIGDNVFRASGVIAAAAAGRTGAVDWQTDSIKTATFTATTTEGYFCNTNGGVFTVNLPAGVAGSIVAISDYTRTFKTNNLTVSPDGSEKMGGVAADVTLEVNGQSATFVYVDSTEGWINVQETETSVRGEPPFIQATGGTITCSGDFKIHTFTGPGTFCVSKIATCSGDNEVSYMVVAGGGAAGGYYGGGGAGGFRESKSPVDSYTASPLEGACAVTVSASPYAVVVGGGGAAAPNCTSQGTVGDLSSALGTSSAGGGFGSGIPAGPIAGSGGSGGGEGYAPAGGAGAGNTPPTSPAQGTAGGTAAPGGGGGGGGGGATAVGANAPGTNNGGAGGAGATTSISATPTAYAGGGGAGGSPGSGGAGGTGGGGTGQPGNGNTGGPSQQGGVNTGGGGGARACCGAGGSGVVIIRYKFQ